MTKLGVILSLALAATSVSSYADSDLPVVPAPRVYWKSDVKDFEISQAQLNVRYDAEIQQMLESSQLVSYVDTCYKEPLIAQQNGSCDVYNYCTPAGTGKSEAWNAFYSAPEQLKPQALDKAIKGVGIPTAQKLIAAGFFREKPRSWPDFAYDILRAEQSGVINEEIVYLVLTKYKAENVSNLGYDPAQCTTISKPCTVYVPDPNGQPVPYACEKFRVDTHTSPIGAPELRRVNFTVRGAQLQSFETDTAKVKVGHEFNDVTVEIGPYNVYNVTTQAGYYGETFVSALGERRVLVDFPTSAIKESALTKQGGSGVFTVAIDPRYAGTAGDELLMRYTVYGCKLAFGGVCGFNGFKPVLKATIPFAGASQTLTFPLEGKMKYKVEYALERTGARWYNTNYTSAQSTNTIVQK